MGGGGGGGEGQAILNNGFAVCMRLGRDDGEFQVVFHEIVPIQPNSREISGRPYMLININQSNQINVLVNGCSQEDDNRPVHKLV